MGSLSRLDVIVVVLFVVASAGVGLWQGRGHNLKEKGDLDYFIANHSVPWWVILLSIVATETSALTFISVPGIAYKSDFTFLQIGLGYILGRTFVARTFLPKFFKGDLVTAYEFLGTRFGVATRRFASVIFLVTRTLADSMRVFATAIPVAFIAGSAFNSSTSETAAIVGISLLTWLYTYYGGMRAVVWTDVIQTFVYLFGAVTALVLLQTHVPGGWSAILSHAAADDKLRFFDFSLRFDRPFTLAAGIIGGGFLSMASHGADQIIVQRILASKNLREGRRALIGSGFVVFFQFFIFLLIGTGIYSYFHGVNLTSGDEAFPKFIAEVMPSGIKGLILAGILASTMSSHAGALNSLAAATTHDIYVPLRKKRAGDMNLLPVGRRFTLLWAVVLAVVALSFRNQDKSLVNVALSVVSFTYGGLLGGFFLGLFFKQTRQIDAIIGMAAGIATMASVALIPSLSAQIAWPWYSLIGSGVTILVGNLSSIFWKSSFINKKTSR